MKKLLFVINQFYKGGAETALLNLFHALSPQEYEVDFLLFDQIDQPNAVSLTPLLPSWVNVCNAAQAEGRFAIVKKVAFKVWQKLTRRQMYRAAAYRFVKGKHYDAAFSYGEWMSPEFVAKKVDAAQKYVWIHADVDKAPYVDPQILFGFDPYYQKYLFVSRQSMESAARRFPFLKGRTAVVHNMCADEGIREQAQEPLEQSWPTDRPVVLTVANFRSEKNHLRQVEAMKILRDRGVEFTWVNVGCSADFLVRQKLDQTIQKYGLETSFLRLPADPNPYKYMKQADLVAVLSDFEAWSLVITEAKLLGVPVLATRTSGAMEQIVNGETGVLCDFDAQAIADALEQLLKDEKMRSEIHRNLQGFSTWQTTLMELEHLLKGE